MTETSLRTLIEKWRTRATEHRRQPSLWDLGYGAGVRQCVEDLEFLLQSSSCGVGTPEGQEQQKEQDTRGVEGQPQACRPAGSTAPSSELLLAFVRKVAAREICSEAPENHPGFDSGPYCTTHGLGDDEDVIREARELLGERG